MSGLGTRDFNGLWNEKKTFIPHSHNIISIQIHRHSQALQPQMPSPPYAFSKEKHEKSYSWGHRRNLQWYLGPRISLGSKEAWKVPDALKSCSSFPQLDHWWNRHQAGIGSSFRTACNRNRLAVSSPLSFGHLCRCEQILGWEGRCSFYIYKVTGNLQGFW